MRLGHIGVAFVVVRFGLNEELNYRVSYCGRVGTDCCVRVGVGTCVLMGGQGEFHRLNIVR